jgi:hypothetical protein
LDGYEVITSDDEKVGRVVGFKGDVLIVEHGTIFKSRHGLPGTFADVDDEAGVVRTTISREVLEGSPKIEGDEVDERAVAAHYGLAGGYDDPPTEGELNRDDPAWTAERDTRRAALELPEEQRARIHRGMGPGEGPNDSISSPGAHRRRSGPGREALDGRNRLAEAGLRHRGEEGVAARPLVVPAEHHLPDEVRARERQPVVALERVGETHHAALTADPGYLDGL